MEIKAQGSWHKNYTKRFPHAGRGRKTRPATLAVRDFVNAQLTTSGIEA
ncbi:protein of unknown function (plasmid) [Cupriavidus taiwanensis]|nr:protein of unknown function [Cupriavidus taiwanensis]